MGQKKIIVFDDEFEAADGWSDELKQIPALSEHYDPTAVSVSDFVIAMQALEDRRIALRKGEVILPGDGSKAQLFDDAEILIVDYDLLELTAKEHGRDYLTGESVAYLARCFSSCGAIVTLNRFGHNPFDLTLKGHPDSFADVNVGSDQIANYGLWTDTEEISFKPWQWPLLPNAAKSQRRRAAELIDHLDEPILRYLGFEDEDVYTFSRELLEYLDVGKSGQDTQEAILATTFREHALKSSYGFRFKDANIFASGTRELDMLIAGVAAARVAKWLDCLVLPGQEILIDAPHLASRFPSLLGATGTSEINTYDMTARLIAPMPFVENNTKHRFERESWLSRPAWWGRRIGSDESIPEVVDPWSAQETELVFCEDVSRFMPESKTREFVADVSSSFTRRRSVNPAALDDDLAELRNLLRAVEYRPLVRFAL